MKRSQLNVVIDPELIQKVKVQARKRGLTLSALISELLINSTENCYSTNIEERVFKIEKELNSLKEILQDAKIVGDKSSNASSTKEINSITKYTNEGARIYGQELVKAFKEITEEYMLSTNDGWEELKRQPSLIQASKKDPKYLELCRDVINGNYVLKGTDLQQSLALNKTCALKSALERWSRKSLIELEFALNDAMDINE